MDEAISEESQRNKSDPNFSAEDIHGEEGLLHIQTSSVLIILLIGFLTLFNIMPGISIIVLPFLFIAAYAIPFLVKEYGKLLIGLWLFTSVSLLAYWMSDSRTRDPAVDEILSLWIFITAILIISLVFRNWPLFVARIGKLVFSKISFAGALIISLVMAGPRTITVP